jgi:hypothetical protein
LLEHHFDKLEFRTTRDKHFLEKLHGFGVGATERPFEGSWTIFTKGYYPLICRVAIYIHMHNFEGEIPHPIELSIFAWNVLPP